VRKERRRKKWRSMERNERHVSSAWDLKGMYAEGFMGE
jgi:hypothetical protein